jgi:tetratricopeptide (TPR) repeat protein
LTVDLEPGLLATLRGLNAAERSGLVYGMIRGSTALGVGLDFAAAFRLANGYHRRAVALAAKADDPRMVGITEYGLGLHEVIQGRLEVALEHLFRAVDANRTSGDLPEWTAAKMAAGQTLAWAGRFNDAMDHGTSLTVVGRDSSNRTMEACGQMVEGLAWKGIGDLDEACLHLQRCVDLASEIPFHYASLVSGGELAQCHLRRGDMDAALAVIAAADAVEPLYLVNGGNALIPLNHARAERWLVAAERSSGPEREHALAEARRACKSALKRVKYFPPGAPEAMLFQGRYEWLGGRTSAARDWWEKSAQEAVRMGMQYDEGLAHAEIGSRLSERTELEKAAAIFAKVGARRDLARTTELLEARVAG